MNETPDQPSPTPPQRKGSDHCPPRGIAPPSPDLLQQCPKCCGDGCVWNDYIKGLEDCDLCCGSGRVRNLDGQAEGGEAGHD